MRTYTSIMLLSLLTISLCVDSQSRAYYSTASVQSATSRQLLSVKTQQEGNPRPPGTRRREFFQFQESLTSQA
jgi:hypothetical protein